MGFGVQRGCCFCLAGVGTLFFLFWFAQVGCSFGGLWAVMV